MKNRRHLNAVSQAVQVWSLEELESRRLMSAGVIVQDGILILTGTSGNDQFYIDKELGGVCVQQYTQHQREDYKYTELTFDILNPLMGLRGVRVDGGDGNDSIRVSEDAVHDPFDLSVTLIGGQGDDSLQGGSGDDVLIGGPGDNLLDGRGGNNFLDGPASPLASAWYDRSSKTLFVTGTRKDDVIEFTYNAWESYNPYHIRIDGGGFWEPDLNGLKRVVIGGLGGNDTIHVDAGHLPTTVYGGAGDDSIFGGNRSDVLIGGSGRDMIFADLTTTNLPNYWQYSNPIYGYDPEQFIERTDGVNRFNDGAGNDVLIGEGPDQYAPPAPAPSPAPVPAPDDQMQDTQPTNFVAPAGVSTGEDFVTAPLPAQRVTPFATNPLLTSDDQLWDA